MSMIWIVEDDPQIALLIDMTLTKDGHRTRKLTDAAKLDAALTSDDPLPQLLLLDLMLRAKSGFDVLSEWKARDITKHIPVIIISARSAESDKVRGLELGAEDYITKPFGLRELQARVRTALRRLEPARERLEIGDLSLLPETRETFLGKKRIDLTAMEFDLLYYMAVHHGQTVTRGQLLKHVWGYNSENDSSRTVDSHIKTLRVKLGGSTGTAGLIQTIRGTGYRLDAGGISGDTK